MDNVHNLVTDPNRSGDISEYYVTTWLWDNGYEVFRNAGCTGSIDMIAYKDGETILIDVKSKNTDTVYGHARTELQKAMGVQVVEFNGQTRKCRWVEHRE